MAKAIAKEFGKGLIEMKSSQLKDKWRGEGEKKARRGLQGS